MRISTSLLAVCCQSGLDERTDEYWLLLMGRFSPRAMRAQAQAATTAALQQFLTKKEGSKLTDARKQHPACFPPAKPG